MKLPSLFHIFLAALLGMILGGLYYQDRFTDLRKLLQASQVVLAECNDHIRELKESLPTATTSPSMKVKRKR